MGVRIVLAVQPVVRENWGDLVPPVKYGNLVDPAKREAKLREWKAEAYETALESPMASVTGDFAMHVFKVDAANNVQAPETFQGTGGTALRARLAAYLVADTYQLLGINIAAAMKRLYLEGLYYALPEKLGLPQNLWYNPSASHNPFVIDPIQLMRSGMSSAITEEQLYAFLGLPYPAAGINAQLDVTLRACQYAGLV